MVKRGSERERGGIEIERKGWRRGSERERGGGGAAWKSEVI